MKSLGYQVLKGRGIAFIDGKKVKIKGSEVGFSLMKIEKIFALKDELEIEQTVEKIKQGVQTQQQQESLKKPITATQKMIHKHSLIKEQAQLPPIELQKQITGLIYQLIKSEHIPDHLAPEWLKKQKKKKRLRHHL